MLDILAAQRLYGASTNATFDGSKTYGFNSSFTDDYFGKIYNFDNNPSAIVTIWSHGTYNTLDLSGFTQNAIVDLTPGTFSSAGGRTNNIAIAFDTVVETAVGGSGNDTIRASDVASTLQGSDGNDVLMGGSAGDTLTGGNGDDLELGGGGTDTLNGGAGSDVLLGGDANDTLTAGSEHDVLNGGAGIDTLTGGGHDDWIQFQAGEANGDTITDYSGRGGENDFLQFFGYGTEAQGATFTQLNPTTWQITSADTSIQETVTVANGATIVADDYAFYPAYTQLENASYMDFSTAGVPTGASATTVAGGGQVYPPIVAGQFNSAGERSLDVGVVATVAPNSPVVLYAGSGGNHGANVNNFTAYQSAIWDLANNPQVVSSSYTFTSQVAPARRSTRRPTSCGPMSRCASSRCSATWAIVAQATFSATA